MVAYLIVIDAAKAVVPAPVSPVGFACCTLEPGIRIFSERASDVIDLGCGRGAIIGPLFERHGPPRRVASLSTDETVQIIASAGATLVERYWGGTISVLRTVETVSIHRDASAAVACFYAKVGNAMMLASDARLLVGNDFVRTAPDLSHIGWKLWSANLPTRSTALEGICELGAGMTLQLHADGTSGEIVEWSPASFFRSRADLSFEDASEQARRIIIHCTQAWASQYNHVGLGLSGGLDSSIVAAALSKTSASVTCLNMVADGAEGDERPFARSVCETFGYALTESHYDLAAVDLDRCLRPDSANPVGWLHEQAYHAARSRLGMEAGTEAFFTGNGGDNIFYNSRSARAVVDRMLGEGLTAAWSTLCDIRSLTGSSYGEALSAVMDAVRAGRGYAWRCDDSLLAPEFAAHCATRRIDHPWLADAQDEWPGDAARAAILLRLLPHLAGISGDGGPPVNPLASRPVVEFFLSLPSWLMMQGGRDRAIVRCAFERELPAHIIRRKTKGGPASFSVAALRSNLFGIRERLLDGRLAGSGIVSRSGLEAALTPEAIEMGMHSQRLLTLVDAEAWIGGWTGATECRTASRSDLSGM